MNDSELQPIDELEPIVLMTGSNEGNSGAILSEARQALEKILDVEAQVSNVYSSPPWGFMAENDFLNQALVFRTKTSICPLVLLQSILDIETTFGRIRKRETGYQSRTLDIDVIAIGDRIINHPDLDVPHPRVHQRRFVLEPVCELVPSLIHPQHNLTFTELLQRCEDPSEVKPFKRR